MILKNYERTSLVTILIVVLILSELFIYMYFYKTKITEYLELSTIVVDKDQVRVIVDSTERKTLYNNSFFYIDNEKKLYSISVDNGVLWQKRKTKYYEMLLNVNLKEKYKKNDIVNVSVAKNKLNLIQAIIKTWGGE